MGSLTLLVTWNATARWNFRQDIWEQKKNLLIWLDIAIVYIPMAKSPALRQLSPYCQLVAVPAACTHLHHYYINQCRYSRKWIHYLNTQIQSDHLQIQCGQSVLNIGFEKQIGIVCSVNTAYVWFPLNLPIFLILIHGSPTIMLKTILVNYSTT